MKLTIIRGPSGSGKSSIAGFLQSQNPAIRIAEADMYFEERKLDFHPTKLPHAHDYCKELVVIAISFGLPVIVSNTGMKLWEIEPYIEMAKEHNYELEIYRTPGPWNSDILSKRNIHKVPLDIVNKQIAKYEPHPDEKEWTNMEIFK